MSNESKILHYSEPEIENERLGLSVVIPAFNEQERLPGSLMAIADYLERAYVTPGRGFEIVVVDDGSRDATAEVARSQGERGVRLLRQPRNLGKGAALRRGVLESRGERVLLSDADLSTPIDDLERLSPHLEKAPLVLGSRAVRGSELLQRQPIYRELMGKTFNKIIRLAGVHGISDTQCGFKLLDGEVARDLFSRLVTPGFAYDVELVWLARKLGLAVAEVGVRWSNSAPSKVRPIVDSLKMLAEIVRFRWLHRRL